MMRSEDRIQRQEQWRQLASSWKPWWLPAGLYDFIQDNQHSEDFKLARSEYLRSRILVTGLIFVILTPAWTAVDYIRAPDSSDFTILAWLRMGLMLGLLGVIIQARSLRFNIEASRLQVCALVLIPAIFYLIASFTLSDAALKALPEYAVIPLLLIAVLSIFPITLVESLLLSGSLLVIKAIGTQLTGYAQMPLASGVLLVMMPMAIISAKANFSQVSNLMRLYRQASVDGLTGLSNRAVFMQQLSRLQEKRVDFEDMPVAILLMDLDHFKKINDTYGHAAGDTVLREFSMLLSTQLEKTALKGRLGGEEFGVVLPAARPEEAKIAAERVRQAVEGHPFKHKGQNIPVTTSIGIASLVPGESPDAALERADTALYTAKKSGRNKASIHPANL